MIAHQASQPLQGDRIRDPVAEMYWRLASSFHAAIRAGDQDARGDALDELAVLARYCPEKPRVQRAALALLEEHKPGWRLD